MGCDRLRQICVFVVAIFAASLGAGSSAAKSSAAERQPTIPIGLDAYRQWARWPYQRIGARAYMRSTYDRSGGNEAADASHFLYQLADDFNVTLDVEGQGVLYFARYNHWHGSPWHYEVDGTDHLIQESSTADPLHPDPDSVFLPAGLLPAPLAFTWSTTKGADLIWVPIPFEDRFRMAYSRTCYGTGYYIYQQYVEGTPLSQPIEAWDGKTPPADDVLKLLARAGTDIAPPADAAVGQDQVRSASGEVENLAAGQTADLVDLDGGPAMLRALELSIPSDQAEAVEDGVRLRITWDKRNRPSVDAPVPLFFGAGSLYNRHDRKHLVKAFPMNIRFDRDRIHLACYFPMPFFHSARVQLVGGKADVRDVKWSAALGAVPRSGESRGLFSCDVQRPPTAGAGTRPGAARHDQDRRRGRLERAICRHIVHLLAQRGPEHARGGSAILLRRQPDAAGLRHGHRRMGRRRRLLGRPDDDVAAGRPPGRRADRRRGKPHNDRDKIESAYRFLLADMMPFGRNARIQLEHGGQNESKEHYETVTYWYALPASSLIKTDTLDVGDEASEREHEYVSADASQPVKITSRYELGVDTIRDPKDKKKRIEIYPSHTDVGRTTTGSSEFTLKLRPDNLGVMLRRKLDYQYPNQRAEVYVADAATPDKWESAGVWYLAGSNTCVYSNPRRDELGATVHTVETSNRRFRDDEFLVPRKLTEGREAIRVRVRFTPVKVPLFPGHPLAELAWSEIRYDAYCYVMPEFDQPQLAAQPPAAR